MCKILYATTMKKIIADNINYFMSWLNRVIIKLWYLNLYYST